VVGRTAVRAGDLELAEHAPLMRRAVVVVRARLRRREDQGARGLLVASDAKSAIDLCASGIHHHDLVRIGDLRHSSCRRRVGRGQRERMRELARVHMLEVQSGCPEVGRLQIDGELRARRVTVPRGPCVRRD